MQIDRPLRYALYGVLALYLLNFAFLGFLVGPFDYDHLSGYYELAWKFWRSAGTWLPEFNPFLCGGRPLGADPQIPIFHPLVVLVPLFGATALIKAEMLVQLGFGLYGLTHLLRRFQVTKEGYYWGLFLFLAGGGTVAKFMVGHVTLGFYLLYPLILHLSYRLSETPPNGRHTLRVAYWGTFLYCGLYKPNFFIYGIPPLFLEFVTRAILEKKPSIVAEAVAATVVSALGNAVIYLPAAQYFAAYPRRDGTDPLLIAFYSFFANVLMPLKAIPKAWYGPGFLQRHEYNLFVGPVAVVLAVIGVRQWPERWKPKRVALLALALGSLWIGLGAPAHELSPFWPYSWLYRFWPGFHSVRVPTRFWFGAYLALVLFSAVGFRRPKNAWQVAALFGLGFLPLFANAAINLMKTSVEAHTHQWAVGRAMPEEIYFVSGEDDLSYARLKQGIGVLKCVDNIEAYKSPGLHEGNSLEITSSSPAPIAATWDGWSRVKLSARGAHPLSFFLNMNHSPLWRYEGTGLRIASRSGQNLSLVSESGTFSGDLVYEVPGVETGAKISFVTCLGFLGYLGFALRRRRKIYRVGLTGGVAAGKTTFAKILRAAGLVVINLDEIGREITRSNAPLLKKLQKVAGVDAVSGNDIDRPVLRKKLFADPALRRRVERVLHPAIWKVYDEQEALAVRDGHKLIVCEAALFVESGKSAIFDELIVVHAPPEMRLERLAARPGISPELAHKIVSAQVSDDARLSKATIVVHNHGAESDLEEAAKKILDRYREKNLI